MRCPTDCPHRRSVRRQADEIDRLPGLARVGEHDRPLRDLAVAGQDAQDALADHGFAGARFAHHRERRCRAYAEAYSPDGLDEAARGGKADMQVVDPEQIAHR